MPFDSARALAALGERHRTTKFTARECAGYAEHYWKRLGHLQESTFKLLEIGVQHGRSMRMWRDFFPKADLTGVEIHGWRLENFSLPRTTIFIGDQADAPFMRRVVSEAGPFDVIIDDGGHVMSEQWASFEVLFPEGLTDGGIYVIEDLHTCYWPDWQGGLRREGSTIERLKGLLDDMNYRAHAGGRTTEEGPPPLSTITPGLNYFATHITGMHFHRSLCFIDKGNNASPY